MITQDFAKVFVTEERKVLEIEPKKKRFFRKRAERSAETLPQDGQQQGRGEPEDMFRRVANNIAGAEKLHNPTSRRASCAPSRIRSTRS